MPPRSPLESREDKSRLVPAWFENAIKLISVVCAVTAAVFSCGIWYQTQNENGATGKQGLAIAQEALEQEHGLELKIDIATNKIDQALDALGQHGTDLKDLKSQSNELKGQMSDVQQNIHNRSMLVYQNRIDLNEIGIAFHEAEQLNSGWHAPNIYEIQKLNPPQPPPQ